ncbi:hypothetical protein EIP91_009337 [Steccherinum ochraceum]|uniref:Uncharacterized protein n=1 Tax=Steccherinum ochraceum TaxID=92696 RepID=A0A4V2MX63_9APHY|nr:hypothetical protein EIP91_009337 [Steccherinum ochraceum]
MHFAATRVVLAAIASTAALAAPLSYYSTGNVERRIFASGDPSFIASRDVAEVFNEHEIRFNALRKRVDQAPQGPGHLTWLPPEVAHPENAKSKFHGGYGTRDPQKKVPGENDPFHMDPAVHSPGNSDQPTGSSSASAHPQPVHAAAGSASAQPHPPQSAPAGASGAQAGGTRPPDEHGRPWDL